MAKRLMLIEGVAKASGPPAPVRARIARYLARRGYKSTGPAASNKMVFSRGSAFGSSTSFSPAKWEVTLTITRADNDAFTNLFEVNTTGQTVTDRERAFWSEESTALVDVIEGREPKQMEATDRRFAGTAQRMFLWMFVYGLLGGIASMVVGFALVAMGVASPSPGALGGIGASAGIGAGIRAGMRKART